MNYRLESLRQILGFAPTRVDKSEQSPAVVEVYLEKRKEKLTKEQLHAVEAARAEHADRHKWRKRRWLTLILVNLLFVVSYYLDVQLIEGALTGSRFIGFHMADLNSALQVMLAYKHVVLNLIIGTTTVFLLWLLLGGRTFCSWVCPYHLVAEWAEKLHLRLAAKGWARDFSFHRGTRTLLWVIFVLLAITTGYTVFETISPTGILSRALTYGSVVGLVWVAALLLFEIFVSRRAWCRYMCPIGLTYGLVGIASPVRVRYNATACHHEGDCRKICMVPHVLDVTIRGKSPDVQVPIGADCTRCGLCVDICPTDSLNFEIAGWKSKGGAGTKP